jgi:hypothetical protein
MKVGIDLFGMDIHYLMKKSRIAAMPCPTKRNAINATIGDISITPAIGGINRRNIDKYGSQSLPNISPIKLSFAAGSHDNST